MTGLHSVSGRGWVEPGADYRPPRAWRNPHVLTIWAAKASRRPQVAWQRERWTTPDGDFVDVDTSEAQVASDAPLLVLLHGLEGGSSSHYAQAMAQATQDRGWLCVVPHFRGCSGEINQAPRAYHSGDHAEVDWMLAQVAERHPGRRRIAVGVSLGGNALMVWAGQQGDAARRRVEAVCAVCSPLDLMASGQALEQGLCRWIYTPMFLRTMKAKARDKWAKPWLHHVALPALVLNAEDDPFVPVASLPDASQVSSHVQLWRPSSGGHVGFPMWNAKSGWRGSVSWMPEAVCDWMASTVGLPVQMSHG
jgi:predicted alpha/beta-fold hydrolase